jgi:tetratricopeptide (TPR) repeat protein
MPEILPAQPGLAAELADLCAAEADATEAKRRAGDLKIRAALLALDAGDERLARTRGDGAEHPLSWALRLALGDAESLDTCVADATKRGDRDDLADLAGLVMWKPLGAERAVELAKLTGNDAPWTLRLALHLGGVWEKLVELLGEVRGEGELEALAWAAEVAEDRLGDRATAVALLARGVEPAVKVGGAAGSTTAAYVIERACQLAESTADVAATAALKARLAVLPPGDGGGERGLTHFLLAHAAEQGGATAEAAAQLAELHAAPELGALIVERMRARIEAKRSDFAAAAAALERAASAGGPFAAAYLRRSAELFAVRVGDDERATPLYERLHAASPSDAFVAAQLAAVALKRNDPLAAARVLAGWGRARGAHTAEGLAVLGLAARAVESAGGEPAARVEAWREALGDERGRPDRNGLEALARAQRAAKDTVGLITTYRRLGAVLDGRRGAAYLAVAGALALDRDLPEAEPLFAEAAERESDDLLVHAGRALLFRRTRRFSELRDALTRLVGLVHSATAKARLYRQLAAVGEEMRDSSTAQSAYEKALELEPENVTTLHAFSRLCSETSAWDRAVELDERAARLAEPHRAAEILCEIGDIHVRRRSDDTAARQAFERALEADARSATALVELAALHRKHQRNGELIAILRRQQALLAERADVDHDEHLALLLELGKAAEAPAADGGDFEVALGAYRDALRRDAGHPEALASVERLAAREQRWGIAIDALRAAPATPRNLRALYQAIEHVAEAEQRWAELAEVGEKELALLEEPRDVARTARALAQLYEEKLTNLDAAARAWHRVDETDGAGAGDAARALQRIYESRGRFADLAAAIERELALGSVEPERRLELWLRLAEIRRGRLQRLDSAAEAYEKVLEIDSHNGEALASLAEIYTTQKRSDALNRILDLRAASASVPSERAAVLSQKAQLLEAQNELVGAQAAFKEAFFLDRANRAAFTAYERVCYKREDWAATMELYDAAIELVEVQRSRAYRLADLYARRGQLQLQYLQKLDEATQSYQRVLTLDPESDAAQGALERIYSTRSDWGSLIAAYERRAELVKDDGKRVEILRRAARVAAAKLRDASEASRLYGRLHIVDPADAEAIDALERHFERSRDYEKLIGILTTRLSLTSGGDESIALHLRIAQLCEEGLRDAPRAIESYRKILDIAPSQKEAIDALGRLYEGTERWAELVEITRRQIRIVTDRAQKALLYFKCGSVMESKFSKEDDAIRYYDAAIKTSPSCLPAVHGLRDLHLRRQDWARVIQTLELEAKLWTEDKERAGVYAHIGQIYGDKLDQEERAISYYEQALAVDKECLPANRALFELYFRRGDFNRALPVAVILTQKVTREGDPVERSEFYRKRAIVAHKTGDARAAAESLVVGLEIRPENLEALDLLVELCRKAPEAYDFLGTFRELEKLYRKRDMRPPLARVLIALAALREHTCDIDGAEQLYLEALKLAPTEYRVAEALVSLHERLRRFEAGAVVLEAFVERAPDVAARSSARFRLAALRGDGAMDARGAALTLEELIEEDPGHRDAHFRLAQELYLLGRFAEAHRACERLIELAAAPGHTAAPEELARYYDYLGRISDAAGDPAGAGRAFRRASDLDPAYAPSVLSLARRAAVGSGTAPDLHHAQSLLDNALAAAEGRGWAIEAPLRRGIARFYANLGARARAIGEYRELLRRAVTEADPIEARDDQVALAELLAYEAGGAAEAQRELREVLDADLRNVPAHHMLLSLYERLGAEDRAARVNAVLSLLGYVDAAQAARPRMPAVRASLSEELRKTRLAPAAATSLCTEALLAVKETLEQIYPILPPTAVPAAQLNDPGFKVALVEIQRLLGTTVEVFVAREVPGGCQVYELPRPTLYVSAAVIDLPDPERRFWLGRALAALRGGWAILARLDPARRSEVAMLVVELCKPESARDPQAQDFVKALPRKSQKALERIVGLAQQQQVPTGPEWLAGIEAEAERAGLLACDDVAAGARAVAVEESGEGQAAAGALIRFYLSDGYHELRTQVGAS